MMVDVSLPAVITCGACKGLGTGPLNSVCASCDGAGSVPVIVDLDEAALGALTLALDQLASQRAARASVAAATPITFSTPPPSFPAVGTPLPEPLPIPDTPDTPDTPSHADPFGTDVTEPSVTHDAPSTPDAPSVVDAAPDASAVPVDAAPGA